MPGIPKSKELISQVLIRRIIGNLKSTWTIRALGRSRPAADATREVVERWLLDGLM
jgi:hypothetical protein